MQGKWRPGPISSTNQHAESLTHDPGNDRCDGDPMPPCRAAPGGWYAPAGPLPLLRRPYTLRPPDSLVTEKVPKTGKSVEETRYVAPLLSLSLSQRRQPSFRLLGFGAPFVRTTHRPPPQQLSVFPTAPLSLARSIRRLALSSRCAHPPPCPFVAPPFALFIGGGSQRGGREGGSDWRSGERRRGMGRNGSVRRSYSALPEDYKLLEEVGHGASATVYRAIYVPANEVVAVKRLDLDRCNSNLVSPLLLPLN
ncbi:hypothetical protein B296_00044592 [Ensete ventricosum]|uniref:Protein kinase domain-containing protein n=1 Tax=Ensete ventricosum TaxID=4639 RepID=A0A426YWB8_ENSVE|nr:hypothetical protein B296_00044592 [Ensete ventricosum]